MEPSDQQLLIERIARTLLFFCGIAALIWCIPDWVREYQFQFPVEESQKKSKDKNFDITSILDQLPSQPTVGKTINGVQFFRYHLEDPRSQANEIRTLLNEQAIENYQIVIDDSDHEVYVYHRGILRARLLFIQNRVAPVPPKNSNPMIAIVIGGLGNQNTKNIVEHPTPLTLAYSPAAPFSISLSVMSAMNWHEVIVDTRGLDITRPEKTLPFASGVLTQ